MPVRIGDHNPARFYNGDAPVERLYAGDHLVWTSFTPTMKEFDQPNYLDGYSIPAGCRYLDIVGVGGGGGGDGGGFVLAGGGGYGGEWAWTTLERGVDIPWEVTTLFVIVGGGGSGGSGGITAGQGQNGNNSIVRQGTSNILLSAPRGAGGDGSRDGKPVTGGNTNGGRDLLYNGNLYVGGGAQGSGSTGNAPGGGGRGGGVPSGNGGDGAPGKIWIYAYI